MNLIYHQENLATRILTYYLKQALSAIKACQSLEILVIETRNIMLYELHCEKTCLRGCRPVATQTYTKLNVEHIVYGENLRETSFGPGSGGCLSPQKL